MRKKERHELLKEMIQKNAIGKQEEFVDILNARGIVVTQATISRDIHELAFVKIPDEKGGYKYALPLQKKSMTEDRLYQNFAQAIVEVKKLNNQLFIQTLPGNAQALRHMVGKLKLEKLFSVLADDEGVFMIFEDEKSASEYYEKFNHSSEEN